MDLNSILLTQGEELALHQHKNPDAIKNSTGTFGADYYVDINTKDKNVELKGPTKGGIPDWKIKDDVTWGTDDILEYGKVCK